MNRRERIEGVYFIVSDDAEMVKIGHSAVTAYRLQVMQRYSPVPLRLAAVSYGSQLHETALHAMFADEWRYAEWFHLSGRIKALIERLAAGETLAECGIEPALKVVRPFGRNFTTAPKRLAA